MHGCHGLFGKHLAQAHEQVALGQVLVHHRKQRTIVVRQLGRWHQQTNGQLRRTGIKVGGGIRDLDTIERYLDAGLRYVIIGTAAVRNPGFLQDACTAFGGHIIVGLDARDGKVATDGWSKLTRHDVVDLAKKFEDFGVESIIYTDIGRDGMLSGINIEATVKLAQALTIPVIASGGLSSMADIEALCEVEDEGIEGVICGRAIYSGDLDFEAAQDRAEELNG